jgi:chromosome segregation ATPase
VSDDSGGGAAAPDVRELAARLDAHATALDDLREQLQEAREERDELRTEAEDLRAENEDLREELADVDARTDLLRLVQNSDEMTAEQRQVALIQNLKRAAENQRERDREPKASLTPEQARAALGHPHTDDSLIYKDMQRAVDLLEDKDVLWYESGGYGETYLKLDLTEGSIPGSITGRGDF